MTKNAPLHIAVLIGLAIALAACGATPSPTLPLPTVTRARTATTAPQAQPTLAPTLPPPTATRPPATATVAPTKAPTATTAPSSDPRDAILKAIQTQMAGKSYRVRQTVESASGSVQNVVEFVPPDRYRVVVNTAAGSIEMVIIGKKAYQKVGDRWIESPMDVGSMIEQLSSTATEEAIKGMSDVKLVGPETLDGVPTLAYTYTSKVKIGDVETTSASKLWVGVADGLPRKQVVEGETMGVKSITTLLFEFDQTIRIEAPM